LQYLGKLMRNADHPAIRTALDGLRMRQRQFRQHLERIDRLCEELITGGDAALTALLDEPGSAAALDRQQLRQLVRKASQADAPEGARRKLFDYLRQHLL
jgi:ribosome-associated protein